MSTGLTILFSGTIAAAPHQAGATWAVLQYLLGLRRLGHEVHLVEPIRAEALQPAGTSLDASRNAVAFHRTMAQFGFENSAALLLCGTRETSGETYDELERVARRADLLINVSGMLSDANLLNSIPTRVYLDLDPAFVQLWHAVEGIDMRFEGHTDFVTVGNLIGTAECAIPTCGVSWIRTFQPVVLQEWRPGGAIDRDAFTTVANWRGYGSIEHEGVLYGQKAHSLRRFFDLPGLTGERFELGLAIDAGEQRDLHALAANGWSLLDPRRVAGTPNRYREFVRGSRAEFGIAKSGYVVSRCGWFSDRSACYLAAARPVVAQETGFSRVLPTGLGLFAFDTSDDVLQAACELRSNYRRHARAARELAETYFDSDIVLTRLLQEIGGRRASVA